MSLMQRISLIFRSKANRVLARAEDPRETLDYSYQRQLDLLTKVKRGVADVATSRKRVELQLNQLQLSAGKLQAQAQQALATGREDLAREAEVTLVVQVDGRVRDRLTGAGAGARSTWASLAASTADSASRCRSVSVPTSLFSGTECAMSRRRQRVLPHRFWLISRSLIFIV